MKCWTVLNWCLNGWKILILRSNQKMSLLSAQHNFPRACTISRGYFCKSREGREGEKLASANQPKRITIIFGVGLLLLHCFIPKFAAITKCLHQLVGPANHQKSKKNKANIEPVADSQLNRQTFLWTGKHQEAFDLLKACLTSVPVLGYPDFNCPFELEMDASLQGLGAVLSQRDETRH